MPLRRELQRPSRLSRPCYREKETRQLRTIGRPAVLWPRQFTFRTNLPSLSSVGAMKIVNLKNPVMASWLREQGFRLDAPPFLSGAIEARKLLEQLPVKKEPLASLTKGHNGGIFNGPKFARTYVDDPEHGVPFVGSSDMLQADLSRLPLLRKTDAFSPTLSYLRLEEGMTLTPARGQLVGWSMFGQIWQACGL